MNRRRAFTYIEITMVAAILGLLIVIAVPNFLEARERAGVSRSKADLAILKMGIEAYRLEYRMYPLNSQAGVSSSDDLRVLTTPVAFMSRIPDDIFNTKPAGGSGPNARPHPAVPPKPLSYFNGYQINGDAGIHMVTEGHPSPQGDVAALIWGRGPGNANPNPKFSPASIAKFSGDGTADLVSYDPTNGTTSAGIIFQTIP